jgi:hypothetical protein
VPLLSHLTPYTTTTSNLYLTYFLAAAVIQSAIYRFLTFQIPNLTSRFRTILSIQVWGKCLWFATKSVFKVRNCQHLAQTQSGRPPLVGCPRLLILYIRSYPPYWRPFLHPQPEERAMLWWEGPTYQGHGTLPPQLFKIHKFMETVRYRHMD